MNIYLVRHGESYGNISRLHQIGTTPLSEKGKKQAFELGQRLKNITIDKVICSDFTRTKETAKQIALFKQTPIEYSPLFREIKRPSEIENRSVDNPEVIAIKQEINLHSDDPEWHYSNEENLYDLIERAREAITCLENQNEINLLIVSHGLFIRTIVGLLLFEELLNPALINKSIQRWEMSNTGITWIKKDSGIWRLVTWNDHSHLG